MPAGFVRRGWQAAVTALALTLPSRAASQSPAASSEPTRVVEAFFTAILDHRWADAAAWLDAGELQRIRRRYLNEPGTWMPPRPMTAEDYQRSQPDMPREVAEYMARRAASRTSITIPYIHEFGLDSIAQLARLNGDDLGLQWVKAHDGEYQIRARFAQLGCPVPAMLDSMFRSRRPDVLGAIIADSSTAYVLFRSGAYDGLVFGEYAGRPTLAALRRSGAGWRLLPWGDLLSEFTGMWSIGSCPEKRP